MRNNRMLAKFSTHRRLATGLPPTNAFWRKTGGCCWFCGCWVPRGPQRTLDHIKPIRAGGLSVEANLVPACHDCNRRKDRLSLEAFRALVGGGLFYGERLAAPQGTGEAMGMRQ